MEKQMKITFPGGLRINAEYKGFVIETDQPAYAGGEASAPAPFDLFLASIGTCSAYYVLAFCKERKIPTKDAYITLTTEKNPKTKRVDRISLEINLPPEFPEKYKNAVLKAVDNCSVKKHILNAPIFDVKAKIIG